MITLAVATGIPMDDWVRWGGRAQATAFELLEELKEAGGDG